MATTSTRATSPRSRFDPFTARGLWLRWLPTFLGFIAGGALAYTVTGLVTTLPAALGGGALVGAVIGAGQWLALRGRLSNTALWIPATIVGQAVGLAGGASLVGYGTSLQDLAIQGAITGLGIGLLQALVLRPYVATWFWWAIAMPPVWALGWVTTTAGGIEVAQHFATFGLFGALVVTALSGLLLVQLLRTSRPIAVAAPPIVEEAVQPAIRPVG